MICRRNILCALFVAVMLLLGDRADVHAAKQTDSLATVIGIVQQEIPSAELMKKLNDTTIFNTHAIRSLPGDGLKDVLEQLPGFSVTDNSVSVDGVKVSRTYVNGILVFGGNPMNAVNALKADEVTQVKVYDEQSAIDRPAVSSIREKNGFWM